MRHFIYLLLLSSFAVPSILAQQPPIYLNCGGPNYTDPSGIFWQEDDAFVNTGLTTSTDEVIANTTDPRLYQTKRWDPTSDPEMTYEIPCQNGEYYVILHFSETQSAIAREAQRLFDVYMEDVQVLSQVDVFKDSGSQKRVAVVRKTAAVVNDNSLTISFRRNASNPIISGIEVHYLAPQTFNTQNEGGRRRMEEQWWTDMDEDQSYTGRHECSFVQAGDKFYLFGGRENPQQLEIYDYTTNVWTIGASPPEPFNHFQAMEYQGLIWVIGSFNHNHFPRETPATHVHVYDPANNVWMVGPAIPRPRGSGGLVVHENKFCLVGGNTIGHAGGFVPWFDEYNPRTGEWRSLPDAPHARDHFHAVVLGNKLYAAGGRRTASNDFFGDTVAEVDVYDFSIGQWLSTDLPDDLPIPRAGTTSAVLDGKVLVIGGESTSQDEAHKEVHALEPETGIWNEFAPLHFGRHGMQAIVSGRGIYVTAGAPRRGGASQRNMEVYRTNSAIGEASVAGSIMASMSVSIGPQQQRVVTILHSGQGNQGVFVTATRISGPDAANFEIVGGTSAAPFFVQQDQHVNIVVRNKGTSNNAQAWLDLLHSGNQWLSIPLGSPPTVNNPSTHTEDTTSSTSDPTTTTTSPTSYLDVTSLILVDTTTMRDILPVYMCKSCVTSDMKISIRAELPQETAASDEIDRVELTLSTFSNLVELHTKVERYSPYTLYGDTQGTYVGKTLAVGEYTVTARAFGQNGEVGRERIESFRVIDE